MPERKVRARLSRSWAALAGWGALLASVATLCVLSGIAAAFRTARPEIALAVWPGDARALAQQANTILLSSVPNAASLARVRADAQAALARDVNLPSAWRVLGLTEPGGSAASTRLLEIAQSLSRRDALTQLALLEMQVERGNIVGALRHYDVILRISTAYDPLLFPVLGGAMADPQVLAPLSARLADAPMWRRRFLSYMVNADTPYDAQYRLYAGLARAGGLIDRDIATTSATNSALSGDYDVAWRLHDLLAPGDARQLLRNGGFEGSGIVPFDWQIDVDGPLQVAISRVGGGHLLDMASVRGDGGRAVRQLLRLPAGRYHLVAAFGTSGERRGQPYLRLFCATGDSVLAHVDRATSAGRLNVQGTVPADCLYQWLDIGLVADPAGAATAAWIDDVSVVPVTAPHR